MSVVHLRIYQDAVVIAGEIAVMVESWASFHRDTVGIQIVRAADAISNFIAEGYGKAETEERLQNLFLADSSLQETKNQFRLALHRGIIEEELEKHYIARLTGLSISMMEFGAAIINRDEAYDGKYRAVIERRRKWLVERNQPLAEGA
ncbi:MAG: four helix bundle protein [Ignavibacteria bacterium]|nr:four helix bundle protein [Ignavibacteria bacterium]